VIADVLGGANWLGGSFTTATLRICLLVLVGSLFGGIPARASNVRLPVSGSRLPFAIDDFDGTFARSSKCFSRYQKTPQVQFTGFNFSSAQLANDPSIWSGPRRAANRHARCERRRLSDVILVQLGEKGRRGPYQQWTRAFSLADPTSFPRAFGGSGRP